MLNHLKIIILIKQIYSLYNKSKTKIIQKAQRHFLINKYFEVFKNYKQITLRQLIKNFVFSYPDLPRVTIWRGHVQDFEEKNRSGKSRFRHLSGIFLILKSTTRIGDIEYVCMLILDALSDNKIDENNVFDELTFLKSLITNLKNISWKLKD